jgi:rhodanese-related sulfurtransferase
MVEEVDSETLHERLEAGAGVQVVDIRPEAEYERGHITGALSVPMSRFGTEIENQEWGEDVVVACPIGKSSIQAARLLQSYEGVPENASVTSLEGGYRGWEYDLETGSDTDGTDATGADGPDADDTEPAEERDVDAPF